MKEAAENRRLPARGGWVVGRMAGAFEEGLRGDGGSLASAFHGALDGERHRFFLWAPVALGAGIAVYFALPSEPDQFTAAAPFVIAGILLVALPRGTLAAALAIAMALAGLGFLLAKVRVESVRAPVLEKRLNNVAITGRIERVEPREKRGARLTIAVEALGDLDPSRRPDRVRIRTMSKGAPPPIGARVSATATLSPPAKPALPGAFDFARLAWFERVGGVGYTFSKVTILPATNAPAPWHIRYQSAIETVRTTINARILAVLSGQTGAIAEALITGERGGISKATNDVFRESGLFHVLSISGLHMVIMAGAVFFALRLLLAAVPGLALRFEIKKWAAVAGIIGALCYLAISGGAFATVRSAIMIVIMFTAMLLDRPALALRNVALAAFVILATYPESLFDAGFQMSFAAVVGLVSAYEEVRRRFEHRSEPHPVLRVALFFGGVVLSTLVAGAAVAPFAAYHFHQSQQYAVLANLLAIPACNFIVMPAALGALVLMPLGLEAMALKIMGAGIDIMSWGAASVARLPGAVGHIPAMPDWAFALMVFGGLWLALWQARWRILGAASIVAGLALAPLLAQPDALIARGGALVAVRGADGNLSALPARQSKYELERWLESDGDVRKASQAADSAAFNCDGAGCTARVKGVLLAVARHAAAISDDCSRADVVVLPVPRPQTGCTGHGLVIDFFDVWREGTHALYIDDGDVDSDGAARRRVRVETVAARRGNRPWAQSPKVHARDLPRPWLGSRGSVTEPGGGNISSDAADERQDAGALPGYAARPEWLQRSYPRPEDEDAYGDENWEDGAPAGEDKIENPGSAQ